MISCTLIIFWQSSQQISKRHPNHAVTYMSRPSEPSLARRHAWLRLRGGSACSFDVSNWLPPDAIPSMDSVIMKESAGEKESNQTSEPPVLRQIRQQEMDFEMQFEEVQAVRGSSQTTHDLDAGIPEYVGKAESALHESRAAFEEEIVSVSRTRRGVEHEGDVQMEPIPAAHATDKKRSNSVAKTRKRSASQMSSTSVSNTAEPRGTSNVSMHANGKDENPGMHSIQPQEEDSQVTKARTGQQVAVTDDALQILGNTNKEASVHHRGDEGLSEIVFSATDREINDTMQNNNSAALFELGVKAMERENGASEAVSWWKKAALLGHVDAIFNMGVCCLQGVGMAEGCNETAAAMWFEKAALQGDGDARVFLIVCPMI